MLRTNNPELINLVWPMLSLLVVDLGCVDLTHGLVVSKEETHHSQSMVFVNASVIL